MKTETMTKSEATELGYRPATNGYHPRERYMLDRELARLRADNIPHCLVESKAGPVIWRVPAAKQPKAEPVYREYGSKSRPTLTLRRRSGL